MENIFWIFPNFTENIYIGMLFVLFIIMNLIILSMQITKNKNTIVIGISMSLTIGVLFLLTTTLIDQDDSVNSKYLESFMSWCTLAWNVFMITLLSVLPIYVFSMVSTTFTNSRHYKYGKKLLITSFLSLWGMTLLGILIALLFIPLLLVTKDLIQLDITPVVNGDKSILERVLGFYSIIVLSTILLAVIFAVVMNLLHKHKHETGERVIDFIEHIKKAIRVYLNYISKLVPYVISCMLILIFNNYGGVFVNTATTLSIFILIFFLGLGIVTGFEFGIIQTLRRNKKEVSRREVRKNSRDYTINVFAVQSAPILYPITVKYTTDLSVRESVVETVPTLSTFMGYSMCGGFYPALIVLFTLTQSNASISGQEINYLLTISIMVPLIMIMTLGMTGVPGADVAIILGLLSTLGLNPQYFFTIYLVEPLLDKFRGVGNAYGFVAASVIADKLLGEVADVSTEELEVEFIEKT